MQTPSYSDRFRGCELSLRDVRVRLSAIVIAMRFFNPGNNPGNNPPIVSSQWGLLEEHDFSLNSVFSMCTQAETADDVGNANYN